MRCEKVLVAVAGKDVFLSQGLAYAAKLKKSRWQGTVEVAEEDHFSHLLNPNSENELKKFGRKLLSPNCVDGVNDPWFNVVGSGSDFSGMRCEKVLVAVAGKDVFLSQGLAYSAKLKKSRWQGTVKVAEEDHFSHLLNPNSENANKFMKKFVEFITD